MENTQKASMSTLSHSVSLSLTILLLTLSILSQATVPPSKTFKYINQGDFGEYLVEYGADYRLTSLFTFPFQLCFYNTTPGEYTLGLRMGVRNSESIMRWVWDANRGNPVGENATLTFGRDGNLVLADADGRIAWQTGTANKGVDGLELLSSGNLVLRGSKGKIVWQSFDHPTDCLLVGQRLSPGGTPKIVSRVSNVYGSEGKYSLVLEKERLVLYLKSKNSPKLIRYYILFEFEPERLPVNEVVFTSGPVRDGEPIFNLMLTSSAVSWTIGRPNYNTSLSFLRLEQDGGLRVYTYNDKADYMAWEITYRQYDKNSVYGLDECQSPTRCGSFGVCEDSQCVACPTPKGMSGWSKDCAPPSIPPCKAGSPQSVDYYKVVGVEHFTRENAEAEGRMKVADCRDKCSKDCGCLGFFYKEESSTCFLAPELGALNKVSNQTHVAYIKTSKTNHHLLSPLV